jgi:hypothetical protein
MRDLLRHPGRVLVAVTATAVVAGAVTPGDPNGPVLRGVTGLSFVALVAPPLLKIGLRNYPAKP